MGYILPITPHQSIQYAEREVGKKQTPYRFVPTEKTMNELQYGQLAKDFKLFIKEEEDNNRNKKERQLTKSKKNKQKSKTLYNNTVGEQIRAEVTGTGQNISESI